MNFTPVMSACWLHLAVATLRHSTEKVDNELIMQFEPSKHEVKSFWCVLEELQHQAFNNSDFSDGVFRFLYCVAICWTELNSHTLMHVRKTQHVFMYWSI